MKEKIHHMDSVSSLMNKLLEKFLICLLVGELKELTNIIKLTDSNLHCAARLGELEKEYIKTSNEGLIVPLQR